MTKNSAVLGARTIGQQLSPSLSIGLRSGHPGLAGGAQWFTAPVFVDVSLDGRRVCVETPRC